MISLHLDPLFKPETGLVDRLSNPVEIHCNSFKFPGGEVHIEIDYPVHREMNILITHRVQSMDDLMLVLAAKDALERKGVKRMELFIPYLPYARQDRVCNDGEAFTLKIFTDILNSANFNRVHIMDCHSEVGVALVNNCVNHSNYPYVKEAIWTLMDKDNHAKNPHLISPDFGAAKKTESLHRKLSSKSASNGVFYCGKVRDTKTGKLSGFRMFSEGGTPPISLVVDDICDGGGTFIGLAELLRRNDSTGCSKIYLFVTHGIFSKGLNELDQLFDGIYTTNSFRRSEELKGENLTIRKINYLDI